MSELIYRNQNATRNLPLSDSLAHLLVEAGAVVGIDAVIVMSGGQPSAAEDPMGQNRTGSTRHDHGNAADIDLDVAGRILNFNDPEDRAMFERFVRACVERGATGIGAGDGSYDPVSGYMGPTRIHVGFGAPAIWGGDRTAATAPDWLRAAYYGPGLSTDQVRRLQQLLRDRGYVEVGNVDGDWGSKTLGALNRARADNGIPARNDRVVTDADWSMLAQAAPAAVAPERENVSAGQLAAQGSRTVNGANTAIVATGASATVGVAGAVAQAIQEAAAPVTEVVNAVQPHIGAAQRILGLVGDLWWLIAIPIAGFAIWQMVKVIRARVEDQRTGKHA